MERRVIEDASGRVAAKRNGGAAGLSYKPVSFAILAGFLHVLSKRWKKRVEI